MVPRLLRRHARRHGLFDRDGPFQEALPDELIAEVALGIDHVLAELQAELAAKLGDVALDYDLVDVFLEYPVHRIEYLRFGHPAVAVLDQEFEDAAFAPWQRERDAIHLRIAAVE